MSGVRIPRTVRHPNAPGKSLAPTLPVRSSVVVGSYDGVVVHIRRKKRYARRYLVADIASGVTRVQWLRRDQFTVGATKAAP